MNTKDSDRGEGAGEVTMIVTRHSVRREDGASEVNTKDMAYIDNYPPLHNWLREREAHCSWRLRRGGVDGPHEYIERWQLPNGNALIVTVLSHGKGWDIYTPCGGLRVDETLADAAKRCGVAP